MGDLVARTAQNPDTKATPMDGLLDGDPTNAPPLRHEARNGTEREPLHFLIPLNSVAGPSDAVTSANYLPSNAGLAPQSSQPLPARIIHLDATTAEADAVLAPASHAHAGKRKRSLSPGASAYAPCRFRHRCSTPCCTCAPAGGSHPISQANAHVARGVGTAQTVSGQQRQALKAHLQGVAEYTVPNVRFQPAALAAFLRLYHLSSTSAERARVWEDWTHLLLGTERACEDAGLSPPYEMHEHPRDALAQSWRCMRDGDVAVEVYFHNYMGTDREEVRVLKEELQAMQAEMELVRHEDREVAEQQQRALELQMQALPEETQHLRRKEREFADRTQREASAELQEVRDMRGKTEELQMQMVERDAKEEAERDALFFSPFCCRGEQAHA